MSSGFKIRVTLLVFLFFSAILIIDSQTTEELPVRLFFYNTENFFDTVNDSITDDDEFLPGGLRRWNNTRLNSKINAMYKVIIAAGEWDPPALAGFCEIENRYVLERLVHGTALSRYNYSIIHFESDDPRGIDVGIIYRHDIFRLISACRLIPQVSGQSNIKTRDVIYAKFLISTDTLHLFMNHWPSRRGGVLAGEDSRYFISKMIKANCDSISASVGGKAKILVAGDFNSSPDDSELLLLTGESENRDVSNRLVNLSERDSDRGEGSYKYQGAWEMLDQILVSASLLEAKKGLLTLPELFKLFKPDFLLIKDPSYPGFTPYSTYRGYRYQGGFSDHLPVMIDLKITKQDQ